jgi:predicted nucleotidyltransferase
MDALVERVTKTIAEAIHPDKIILFGSRANGTATEESDIDLVVVYSGAKTKREVRLSVHRLFDHPDFALDLFVFSPEEMERQRIFANTIAREVSERGVVCYG